MIKPFDCHEFYLSKIDQPRYCGIIEMNAFLDYLFYDQEETDKKRDRYFAEIVSKSSPVDFSLCVNDETDDIIINGIFATVDSYDIIVPDKVMKVFFRDGSEEKMILHPDDTFSVEDGIRIAIAKHTGRKYYNQRGIENLADKLKDLKAIDKMIHKAKIKYKRKQEAEEKELEIRRKLAKQGNKDAKKAIKKAEKRKHRIRITKTPHVNK